jgi:glycerol kinase
MSNYILVIDEGTTGTRALIFDKKFSIVSQAYEEFTQYTPADYMVEHDGEEIYEKSVNMCKKALESANLKSSDIAALGITNQRNTSLAWNKTTGKPYYNAIVWQDTRVGGKSDAVKQTPYFQQVLNETGKVIAPHCAALLFQWLMENVEAVREDVKKGEVLFGTIDSWLIWKLTGGKTHATSFSNASSSGCIDLSTLNWNKSFLDRFNAPISAYPKIQSESSNYGTTDVFGSPIPILSAVADQQSALFAQGCLEPGSVKCTNGTGSFMDINVGSKLKSIVGGGVDTLIAWKFDGKDPVYCVEGFAAVTGSAVQWLRDGLKIIKKSSDIEALAASVKDSNGVYFVPGLVGLITPYQDPFARGLIIGIHRGVTEAHIARATIDAIALRIKDILNVVEKECNVKISEIKIDGGASENNLIAQTIANYSGAKVVKPNTVEATSLGAALMASLALGNITLEDVKTALKSEKEFTPDITEEQREAVYGVWSEAVKRSLNWIKS